MSKNQIIKEISFRYKVFFKNFGLALSYIFLILLGGNVFFIFFLPVFLIYVFVERSEKNITLRIQKILFINIGSIVLVVTSILLFFGLGSSLMRIYWDGPTTYAYNLSNGEKSILFQGLYHIGTPEYYREITSYLDIKQEEGYDTVFLERIGTGSMRNEAVFARATGYDDSSDGIGDPLIDSNNLTKQSYSFLLGNFEGYNTTYVDMSVDDIIRRARVDYPDIRKRYSGSTLLIDRTTLGRLLGENTTQFGKKYFELFTVFAFYLTPAINIDDPEYTDIGSDLVLNYRDEHLTKEILRSEKQKILILYGEGHIPGVYRNLRSTDPRWQLIEKISFRVLQK